MTGSATCRIVFLTLYPETMPSSRLRAYQYLPYLQPLGIEADVLPAIPEPWFSKLYYSASKGKRFLQYALEAANTVCRTLKTRRYDALVIQKGLLSTNFNGFERLIPAERPMIFDFDDLIYGMNIVSFSHPFLRKLQDPDQTKKISAKASAVIAGNTFLKEQALLWNSNVHVIPTPVDTLRFVPPPQMEARDRHPLVIGWIGMESGLPYLAPLKRVFEILAQKSNIKLKIITRKGVTLPEFGRVPVEYTEWSHAEEPHHLRDFDIGIMPLDEDAWSRGKCSYKLLQYMACGIPSVASRVGTNCEVMEDGEEGFLASGTEEWLNKLSILIENRDLRRKMGEAARKKVEANYSLAGTAPRFAEILKNPLRQSSVAPHAVRVG